MTMPAVSEEQFEAMVTQLAEYNGWEWMHVRPMQTQSKGWATGTTGTMAKGWPDLVLLRGERLLFVECKASRGAVTKDQERVLALLHLAGEVYIWRPADWAEIERILKR